MEPTPTSHQVTGVEVSGGTLAVEVLQSSTEPVLAIHGISSQRKLWNRLRAADPGLSLIMPDLRGGRAGHGLPGPGQEPDLGGRSPAGAHATAALIAEALTNEKEHS